MRKTFCPSTEGMESLTTEVILSFSEIKNHPILEGANNEDFYFRKLGWVAEWRKL